MVEMKIKVNLMNEEMSGSMVNGEASVKKKMKKNMSGFQSL